MYSLTVNEQKIRTELQTEKKIIIKILENVDILIAIFKNIYVYIIKMTAIVDVLHCFERKQHINCYNYFLI